MGIIESIGTFIAMVAMLPVLVILAFPLMGIISLVMFSSFSWLYAGIIGLLFTIQLVIPKSIRNITRSGLSFGIILMWLLLALSNKDLMNDSLSRPDAIGGFPILAFEYPPAALGGNEPPIGSWGLFYFNLFFWIAVGAGIAIIFRNYLTKQISIGFLVASVIISLYGLGYLLVKFD